MQDSALLLGVLVWFKLDWTKERYAVALEGTDFCL